MRTQYAPSWIAVCPRAGSMKSGIHGSERRSRKVDRPSSSPVGCEPGADAHPAAVPVPVPFADADAGAAPSTEAACAPAGRRSAAPHPESEQTTHTATAAPAPPDR